MPQASEIQRPTALADSEDAVKGIVIEASGVVTEEKLLTARDELEQDRKKNPSIVSIFALILRYHVPLIDLHAPRGVAGGDDDEYEWKEVHLLGAGTSCSVTRYETDSQIKDIYPPGMRVSPSRLGKDHVPKPIEDSKPPTYSAGRDFGCAEKIPFNSKRDRGGED